MQRPNTEPTNKSVAPITCLTCKRPMLENVINYVSGGYDWEKKKTLIRPCPTCSSDMVQREAVKREMETITRIFGEARIPWRARNWDFNNFPSDADQKAKMLVQDFVSLHLTGDQETKRFLYLGGATGRCKTSLALCALKEILKAGRTGLYVLTAELMVKLQSSMARNADISQDDLLAAITHVEWLILDDLAVESGSNQSASAYTLKSLYLIIQKRADMGLYTIITSNLTPSDLERYWRPAGVQEGQFHEGLRIVERLREYCIGCSVSGRNQRGKER